MGIPSLKTRFNSTNTSMIHNVTTNRNGRSDQKRTHDACNQMYSTLHALKSPPQSSSFTPLLLFLQYRIHLLILDNRLIALHFRPRRPFHSSSSLHSFHARSHLRLLLQSRSLHCLMNRRCIARSPRRTFRCIL